MAIQELSQLIDQFDSVDDEPYDAELFIDYVLTQFDGKRCFTAASRTLIQDPFVTSLVTHQDLCKTVALVIPKLYQLQICLTPFKSGIRLDYIRATVKSLVKHGVESVILTLTNTHKRLTDSIALEYDMPALYCASVLLPDNSPKLSDMVWVEAELEDFDKTWAMTHKQAVASYYLELYSSYTDDVKVTYKMLKDLNLLETVRQQAKTKLKLHQIELILGVLHQHVL